MQHHSFDGISFVDAQGIYRVIYGCPLKQRRELAHSLNTLHSRLKASKLQTISDLYDHDPEFSAIADHCLTLARIDPNWLSIDMLTEFLLPHRSKEGEPQKPLLEQLNFPRTPNPDKSVTTEADAIAALWGHTKDLEQALRLADSQPWEELSEILQARNAQSPEGQEQKELEAIARDLEARVSGGNLTERVIASPEQTDQLLEAMLG